MPNRICSVTGCERAARARGWCQAHYFRWRRTGSTGVAAVAVNTPKICAVDECERKHLALGLCDRHFQRYQKWGDPYYVDEHATGRYHWAWRGDDIGYGTAHERIRKTRGSASDHRCSDCGGVAAQWAYDHEDPDERHSDLGSYSTDPSHYRPLCVSCHKRFDLARLVG